MTDKKVAIEADLIDIVKGFKGGDFVEPPGAAADAHLFDDLGLDSLDVINLLFQLEEKYGVKISAEDVKERDLMVLGKLSAFIAGK